MRVLLDECVDWRLSRHIVGHEVKTVQQSGWTGTKNGELLALAAEAFDVFVTVDRNLAFQQNLDGLPFPIVVMHATSNRLADLQRLVPGLLAVLTNLRPGVTTVS
jgi:predicted nuclease of predicted toxin-antitoxin system